MRLDRLLTLYFFSPILGSSRGRGDLRIPILMYHSIAEDVDCNVHPYYRTVTTPKAFKRHMEYLSQSEFQVLTLSQAVHLLLDVPKRLVTQAFPETGLHRLPNSDRLVVITFDDGFRDFHTTAFPILEKFGFKATVFLSTGHLDGTFITGRECLRAGEVRDLASQGIEFGSHTVTHPQLKGLSIKEIVYELAASKRTIEEITDSEVTLFSYPYRFPEEDPGFISKLSDLLIQQGYSAGVTTAIGLSRPCDARLFLRRLPVNDCDDTPFLRAKLEGAYDWLHKGQLLSKRLRAMSGK